MLLYLRTSKTASSTVNDWLGADLSKNATHNILFLNHGNNENQVKEAIDNNWFIFTTVRNPFTRAISQWQQSIKSLWLPKDTSFEDYMQWDYRKVNEHCITHNCTLKEYLNPYFNKIDKIIKIEELELELRHLELQFKLGERRIGFFNKAPYRTRFDYQGFYNKDRTNLVLDKYSDDFDTFNYSKSTIDI